MRDGLEGYYVVAGEGMGMAAWIEWKWREVKGIGYVLGVELTRPVDLAEGLDLAGEGK